MDIKAKRLNTFIKNEVELILCCYNVNGKNLHYFPEKNVWLHKKVNTRIIIDLPLTLWICALESLQGEKMGLKEVHDIEFLIK